MGVKLRTLHFINIDLNVFLGNLLQLFLQFVDLSAAFSDDDTGTGRLDGDSDELQGPFDNYLAEAGLGKTAGEILADFIILGDLLSIVSTTPVGVPTTGDTDSVANRISFLSHSFYSSVAAGLTSRIMVMWLERLRMRPARP